MIKFDETWTSKAKLKNEMVTIYLVEFTTLLVCASCSDSPESGLGTSHTSLPDSDDAQQTEYYDVELLPPLGTCKALYPFEGTAYHSNLLVTFLFPL